MHLLVREKSEDSQQLLRLIVPSARSGGSSERNLRFVESERGVHVLAATNPLPEWAATLTQTRAAFWRIGREEFTGQATPITGPGADQVVVKFEEEFGADRVRRWFGSSVLPFELLPMRREDVTYRQFVESYFDGLASSYDASVAGNSLDRELRARSIGFLLRVFRPGDRVLELGCGTGLETLALAARGIHVVATDISGEMIHRLREKAKTERLDQLVEAKKLAAGDIGLLVETFGSASFDGAFSTFGALNCEESLEGIPVPLSQLLRARGSAVFGVWNRPCAAELALSVASGHFRRAFARYSDPVPVGLSRFAIPVYAWSFGAFVRPFLPYFRVERVLGLPVFVPPYDYDRVTSSAPGILRILQGLDARVAGHFPFNRFGDHFLVELRRR